MKRTLMLMLMVSLFFTMGLAFNTDNSYAASSHSHKYKVVKEKKATCEKAGYKKSKCKCGKTKKVVLKKKAHSYKTYKTKAATCTKAGAKYSRCKFCDAEKKVILKKKGHSLEKKITSPTCTEEGREYISCKRCDYKAMKRLPVTKHQFECFETVDPTCEMPGVKYYCCIMCGTVKEDFIEPLEHEVVMASSCVRIDRCTSLISVTTECLRCDKLLSSSSSFDYSHECMCLEVHEPSGTNSGYKENMCRKCGDIFIEPF